MSAIRKTSRLAAVSLLAAATCSVSIAATAQPTNTWNQSAARTFTTLVPASLGPANSFYGANVDIYLVPHQDDEVLSMGALIAQSSAAGREVWIVNYTDGRASDVCANHGTPVCQGRGLRGTPLSTFIAMRDAELFASSRALGVPADHVSRDPFRTAAPRLANSRTTVSRAMKIIAAWHSAYPAARFTAMSWNDDNSDHAHMGEALKQAVESKLVAPDLARFTEFRPYWHRPSGSVRHYEWCGSEQCRARIVAAMAAYRRPYGIGWASVPTQFQSLLADPWRSVAVHSAT